MRSLSTKVLLLFACVVCQLVWVTIMFLGDTGKNAVPIQTVNAPNELNLEVLKDLVAESNISPELKRIIKDLDEEERRWNPSLASNNNSLPAAKVETTVEEVPKTKTILFWNEAYGDKNYAVCCGSQSFQQCEYKNCHFTNDRNYLKNVEDYDMIQFHQRSTLASDLPAKRSPHQVYMHWMMESAAYPFGFSSTKYNGFFNWTYTYRRDSDFQRPYGVIEQFKKLPDKVMNADGTTNLDELDKYIRQFGKTNRGLIQGRNKSVAWFVSHCGASSKRDQYVKELQKHIDVDIYGHCGTKQCSRKKESECWKMVEQEYMFYLSFENSLCKDYITEKFYNAMNHSVVAVTLGGALNGDHNDYEDAAGAPRHSFIDVLRGYPDPAKLAAYLKSLRAKPSLYAEYFWWKDFYRTGDQSPMKQYCDVCKRLHTMGNQKQVVEHLDKWWVYDAKCRPMKIGG